MLCYFYNVRAFHKLHRMLGLFFLLVSVTLMQLNVYCIFIADPRMMGDQDLRAPPLIDHDMRPPPVMMGSDKDMRHPPMGDQDLRPMNAPPGLGDNRTFNDPRYRNVPPGSVTDMGLPTRGPPAFDRPGPQPGLPPDVRPGFDGRGVGMPPRMDDPRGPNMPPVPNMPPGRMPPVSS